MISGEDWTSLSLSLCALRGGEVGFLRLRCCGWAEVLLRRRGKRYVDLERRGELLWCGWRWRARAGKLGSRDQFLGCEHKWNLESKKRGMKNRLESREADGGTKICGPEWGHNKVEVLTPAAA